MLNLLEPGDEIMADRGFAIEGDLYNKVESHLIYHRFQMISPNSSNRRKWQPDELERIVYTGISINVAPEEKGKGRI